MELTDPFTIEVEDNKQEDEQQAPKPKKKPGPKAKLQNAGTKRRANYDRLQMMDDIESGTKVSEIAKKHGVSTVTVYKVRSEMSNDSASQSEGSTAYSDSKQKRTDRM